MAYDKPLPLPNPDTRAYWEGCKAHQLLVQTCNRCGHAQLYPRSLCRRCHAETLTWTPSSGLGTVYSFTVVRRAPSKAFKEDLPYVVAIVELAEGVRMMTNIVGCPPERVEIGLAVRVLFEDVSDTISLPKFEPVAGAPGAPA